ncbi:glucosamine--fructose-6-phosphate aminotransferase [Franconibacter daqui]|uniref:SIS domain-containing protein n=1 Tax=Franconibacter daqui TaxID=2047724 RepID=UPI001663C210|nr:SIS domain-containing protein [Franconibacter daqui]GGD16039.1 glucosamine--fructose-6-phosphate aminotransferase [Franconibacter daqui]
MSTPYENDIAMQPQAINAQLANPLPQALHDVQLASYDRIILTGMGSSDYALIPVERALANRGYPVWRIDAGRLLDMPGLITENTLLWATSQSGMSGEVVALLAQGNRPRTLIGLTNDRESVLAKKADILVTLESGDEATVSSKSYLNTLIACHRALAVLLGEDDAQACAATTHVLAAVQSLVGESESVVDMAEQLFTARRPRIAYIGTGSFAANALTGALITKEASKVSAEGFIGGEFRHGPLETSGEGMLAVLLGKPGDETLEKLAAEMLANGTQVVTIGSAPYAGSRLLSVPEGDELGQLLCGFIYIEHLTVALARKNGFIPGHFLYGQKITVAV